MALTRPLVEWPLLICGPMLRRVSPDEVAVFVATRTACTVQLLLSEAGDTTPAWVNIPLETRALGLGLHVTVCHLTMPAGERLAPGVVYQYDLRMTPTDSGATETLADQPGLLTGAEPLGYAEGALPSFSLPPGLDDLNLLHGSCRKPHGGGPDALAMVDRLIDRARSGDATTQARRRPHQLLLTGDQIYSDDVALALLATLQEAGGLLCAQSPEESFPGGVTMGSPQLRPGTARASYLEANSKLSSGHGMNHLMFLAEFCAMYVMCWSDELWPREASGRLRLGSATVEEELAKQDAGERIKVAGFLRTLRRARRALANVPTLMMFDDHEISDDWNLDRGWRDNARSDPVQHRVVRNGLLAFAVFQAWGNEPSRFGAGVPLELLDLVTIAPGATAPPLAADPAAADVALDLTAAGTAAQRMTWNWTVDGPEHRVIALDTRTRRDYASAGPRRAGLLTAAELQRQLTDHRPPANDNRLCFVVSPAPVVGHPLVERVLQPGMAFFLGGRAADHEAWSVNRITYQAALRRLADFGRVVVLSGDVHYAFSNDTAYFGAGGQPPARIVQLCSSAGKNADKMTRTIQGAGFLGEDGEGWLGFASGLTPSSQALLLAALRTPVVLTTVNPIQHNLLSRVLLFGLFATPAVVPTGPWGSVPAWLEVKRLVDRQDPADWRYQVTFLQDRRSGGQRLATALEIDPRAAPSGALDVIREAHKAVVGEPNIGQVRVRSQDGRPVVVHRIHWMTSGDPAASVQTCTEHVARLGPPGPEERPEPFL